MKFKDLEGKTIKKIKNRKHSKYDDFGYLDVEFTDGAKVCIVGGYGGYTGNSFDEYITRIKLEEFGFEDKIQNLSVLVIFILDIDDEQATGGLSKQGTGFSMSKIKTANL